MVVINRAAFAGPHAGDAVRQLETAALGKPANVRQVGRYDGFQSFCSALAEDVLLGLQRLVHNALRLGQEQRMHFVHVRIGLPVE